MNSFFVEDITEKHTQFVLNEEESKHACRVLRLKNNDLLHLLNGNGYLFTARILDDNPKKCVVAIDKFFYEKPSNHPIHIAISPTKNLDRFEWFLEKATEIGIDIITPIIGDNSERKHFKEERFKKILVAALKQSKRLYLPKICPTQTVIEFIQQNKSAYIAHCETAEKKDLSKLVPLLNVPIMIGPEGDFSKKEIDAALKKEFFPIDLGNNRLRTETAGIYATLIAKIRQK